MGDFCAGIPSLEYVLTPFPRPLLRPVTDCPFVVFGCSKDGGLFPFGSVGLGHRRSDPNRGTRRRGWSKRNKRLVCQCILRKNVRTEKHTNAMLMNELSPISRYRICTKVRPRNFPAFSPYQCPFREFQSSGQAES
jgi:hypothetical protein